MSRVILSVVSILMIANHPLVANDQQVRSMLVEIYLQNPESRCSFTALVVSLYMFLRIIFLAALPSCRRLNRDRVSSKSIFDRTFLYPHFLFLFFYRSFFLNFFQLFFFFLLHFLRARAVYLFHSAFFFFLPQNVILSI